MNDMILLALVAVAALIVGFALHWWLASRPTTTKAEAIKLLMAEAALIAKMPGAVDARAEADLQIVNEQQAALALSAALSKLVAPSVPPVA